MILEQPFEKRVTITGSYCHEDLTFEVEGSYIENTEYIAMRFKGQFEVDIEGVYFLECLNPKLKGDVMWANEWDDIFDDIKEEIIKQLKNP